MNRGGVLVDDFNGHSIDVVKDYVKSFKSGHWLDDEEDRHGLVDVHTMAGGITPKVQPLGLFPIKVMKGCCRDLHGICMLTSPVNPRTGHPMMPSHQLCATWVVEAWDKVPESSAMKAWKVGNYKNYDPFKNQVKISGKQTLLIEMKMKLLNPH